MANIIDFKPRPRPRPSVTKAGKPAAIIIFPGVRYERLENVGVQDQSEAIAKRKKIRTNG